MKQLPPEEHPSQFRIMMALVPGENSSYGISKILEKSQSNIYTQMKPLEEENYIIKTGDYKFKLNSEKLFSDFIDFVLERVPEDTKKIDKIPSKKEISKNHYIRKIFFDSLDIISKEIKDWIDPITLTSFYQFVAEVYLHNNLMITDYIKLDDPDYFKAVREYQTFYELFKKDDDEFIILDTFRLLCIYTKDDLFKLQRKILCSFNDYLVSKKKPALNKFRSMLKKIK